MKLLMTTDTLGGVWTYSLELARSLLPYDMEIALATMGRPLSACQWRDAEILPNMTVYESRYKLEWMQDPWNDVDAAGEWLLRIAESFRPDIVHLNNFAHGSLDWERPVVMVGHSCVFSWFQSVRGERPGPEWRLYRERVSEGLRRADLVVAPTSGMLRELDRYYGPLPDSQVIFNGRELRGTRTRRREPFILSAGRLWDEAKNVALLGRIADRLKWPIFVAGENHHPDHDGAGRFPGLELLGALSSAQMADWYSAASVYALPARYEPFGLTPVEAALCGCPLVLGDLPTLREVWGESATYVDPRDEEAWTQTLRELIDSPGLRRERAEFARERARFLNLERMGQSYWRTYQQLQTRPLPCSALMEEA